MINVTCAIIRNEDNEVLIVQRGETTDHPLKWEFPGGKLAKGESVEECIIREIKEELSMDIVICGRVPEVEHDYGHKQIKLIPFICDTLDDMPFLSEHLAYRWIAPEELNSIDFSEADIPVAESYYSLVKKENGNRGADRSEEKQSFSTDRELQDMVNRMMSMKEAEWIATSAIENPAIFKKLYEYSFSSDKKLAFRASWTLSKVCDKFPDLIYPYLPEIINRLGQIDNESTQRSFLRIISLSDFARISVKQHGILAEHCFAALKSGFSAIAIKAYSMEILYNLVVIYPELLNELTSTINLLEGEGSAGIVARGNMILKRLAKTPISPKSSLK
ncbi:MAG: (deoxy)nucleoside triphosphate pyrophosphohydrolase [Bacteroidales bacterium]|nr:(deoxy)nucleoside triphosphate pyrophosphohydrolase [Bacteroidales bacterium]